jgi:hypothetical protein
LCSFISRSSSLLHDARLLLGRLGADDPLDGLAHELFEALLVEHLDVLEPLLLEVLERHLLGALLQRVVEV